MEEFKNGVDEFIRHSMGPAYFISEGKIICSCLKCCKRSRLLEPYIAKLHLYKSRFKPNYWIWTDHGEVDPNEEANVST